MSRLSSIAAIGSFILAGAVSTVTGIGIAEMTESRTVRQLTRVLTRDQLDWAIVTADGLRITVSGEAPSESARFAALTALNAFVDSGRVTDGVTVRKSADLAAPVFSVEMLRNGDGISLIGLIPAATGREAILSSIEDVAVQTQVTDMLEAADHPVPPQWQASLDYALANLRILPRSKISVTAGQVVITAISDSPAEKAQIERRLASTKPADVIVLMNISAPRPVITPFLVRFILDADGARFDSCAADTEAAAERILTVARAAGMSVRGACDIGLGAPSPRWAEAVELSISALTKLGGGSVTLSDADIAIIATDQTEQGIFDTVIHDLETQLPGVFSVNAVLPPKLLAEGEAREAPEFVATRAEDGTVAMRGRLPDEGAQQAVRGFAQAMFGSNVVTDTSRLEPALPEGWTLRVMAGLEAARALHDGEVAISEDRLRISGRAAKPEVISSVSRVLAGRLGESAQIEIDITYDESLDPALQLPEPSECIAEIGAILAGGQIAFAPSSAKIDADSLPIIDRIADVLRGCPEFPMEVGGYTDSQGRETMNQTLSEARAEAVVDALAARAVLVSQIVNRGYGERHPIATNETEEGRAANRRIEFSLGTDPKPDESDAAAHSDDASSAEEDGSEIPDPESLGDGEEMPMGEQDGAAPEETETR